MKIETRKTALAALAGAMALSSAAAFSGAASAADGNRMIGADDTVHCYGVHSCKGHGFKAMKAGECLSKGGKIGDLG